MGERALLLGSWQNHDRSGYIETSCWGACVLERGALGRQNSLAILWRCTKNKNHSTFREWIVQCSANGLQNFMGRVLFVGGEVTASIARLFMTQVDSFCKICSLNIADQPLSACGLGVGRAQS